MLEEDDLDATYTCLKAWREGAPNGGAARLFAFFNSGLHSGASQPHRHLQFLPVESMHDGDSSAGWDLLIESVLSSPGRVSAANPDGLPPLIQDHALPFTHFAYRFSSEPSGPQLLQMYNHLYKAAKEAVDDYIKANPGQLALHPTDAGDLPISYNLAMTTAGMAIMPRRSEGHVLRGDDGTEIGLVQLNGTALGGTLMVKAQKEFDELRKPEQLDTILRAIGIPRSIQTTKL